MNLSLSRRLLLSLVPTLSLLLAGLIAVAWIEIGVAAGIFCYGLLTGYCVLAPLASGSRIPVRVFLLAITPLASMFLLALLNQIDVSWAEGTYVRMIIAGSLLTAFIGLVVALVAPLKIRRRYWLTAVLSGALVGLSVAFYAEEIFCIFCSVPVWYPWTILVPIAAWPVLLCLTFHSGRRADDPGLSANRIRPASRKFFRLSVAALVFCALCSAATYTWSDMYRDRAIDMHLELVAEDRVQDLEDMVWHDESAVNDKEQQLNQVLAAEAHKDNPAWQEEIRERAKQNEFVARALQLSIPEAESELAAARARHQESVRVREAGRKLDALAAFSFIAFLTALFWVLFWLVAGRRTVRG